MFTMNFQLSGRSSSFFNAFFLHFYGKLFFNHPILGASKNRTTQGSDPSLSIDRNEWSSSLHLMLVKIVVKLTFYIYFTPHARVYS